MRFLLRHMNRILCIMGNQFSYAVVRLVQTAQKSREDIIILMKM